MDKICLASASFYISRIVVNHKFVILYFYKMCIFFWKAWSSVHDLKTRAPHSQHGWVCITKVPEICQVGDGFGVDPHPEFKLRRHLPWQAGHFFVCPYTKIYTYKHLQVHRTCQNSIPKWFGKLMYIEYLLVHLGNWVRVTCSTIQEMRKTSLYATGIFYVYFVFNSWRCSKKKQFYILCILVTL